MSEVRLGIIGCGDVAGYLALFSRITPGVRLAACCDRTLTIAQTFARRHRIPRAYDDSQALIDDPGVDALYLATPHHLHYPMLAAAVRAGKPILCEKPVTRTLAEGIEIVRLAEGAGVKLGVNYQYRYDPAAYALARACQKGQLGRLLYARANLPWHRGPDYFHKGAWRAAKATAGGGTLLTQGSHLLDLALWAMGCRPLAAQGLTGQRVFQQSVEVEDLANGILDLEGGTQLAITSAMVARPEQALTLEIYGENGTAVYTDRPWPRVRYQGIRVFPQRPPVFGLHALHRSLAAFCDWLLHDRPYLTPARSALPALAAVDAIYQSAETGMQVRIHEEIFS